MITLEGLEPHQVGELIPLKPIFVGMVGSHSHGTYVPPSDPQSIDDKDIIVVYIEQDLSRYFGLRSRDWPGGQHRMIGHWDSAAYEMRQFVHLVRQNNPNLFSLLWLDKRFWIHTTSAWEALVAFRRRFVSKQAYKRFGEYARAQLHRMTSAQDQLECCGNRLVDGKLVHSERCRSGVPGQQKRYQTGELGDKRKRLVEKFGYDTKNAAHAVRILRMAAEYLTSGEVQLDRTGIDADELISIKKGEWPLDRVNALVTSLNDQLELAHSNSALPVAPDHDAIDSLLLDLMCSDLGSSVIVRANRYHIQGVIEKAPLQDLSKAIIVGTPNG